MKLLRTQLMLIMGAIIVIVVVINFLAIRDQRMFLKEQYDIGYAQELYKQGEYNKTILILNDYKENPRYGDSDDINFYYGMSLVELGRIKESEIFLLKTLNNNPYLLYSSSFEKGIEVLKKEKSEVNLSEERN